MSTSIILLDQNFNANYVDIMVFEHSGICDAMMHVLKDFINLKYSELLTEEISKSN